MCWWLEHFYEEKGTTITSSTSFLAFPVSSPAPPSVCCLLQINFLDNRLFIPHKKPTHLTWSHECFQATGNLRVFLKSHCTATVKILYCQWQKILSDARSNRQKILIGSSCLLTMTSVMSGKNFWTRLVSTKYVFKRCYENINLFWKIGVSMESVVFTHSIR